MAKLSVIKNKGGQAPEAEAGESKGQKESPEPASEGGETKPKGKRSTLFLLAGAVVVGAGLGVFVLGPRFLPAPGAAARAAGNEEEEEEAEEPAGKHGGAAGGNEIEYKNIIVNPAGEEGVHFLMVSAVFEVHSIKAEKFLREHEHLVKDAIINTLGSLTLEALSKPGSRQVVKDLLAHEIGALANTKRITVYLPEFVVQ